MASLNQLKYEKPMTNQWTTMNKQRKQLFLKVYGRPKPAKIWKTNQQSMKTNEKTMKNNCFQRFMEGLNQLKYEKQMINQWKPMKNKLQTLVCKCLWDA